MNAFPIFLAQIRFSFRKKKRNGTIFLKHNYFKTLFFFFFNVLKTFWKHIFFWGSIFREKTFFIVVKLFEIIYYATLKSFIIQHTNFRLKKKKNSLFLFERLHSFFLRKRGERILKSIFLRIVYKRVVLQAYLFYGNVIDEKSKWTTIKCRKCPFSYIVSNVSVTLP